MVKTKTVYTCQSWGYQSPKWLGKCPDCNQWNSMVEEKAFEKGRELQVFEGSSAAQPITTLVVKAENTLERILDSVKRLKPGILIIDSIQTVYTQSLESSPGSVSQVRETSSQLISNAKGMDMPIFL